MLFGPRTASVNLGRPQGLDPPVSHSTRTAYGYDGNSITLDNKKLFVALMVTE